MDRIAQSDLLHARARAFVRAFEAGTPPPEPFDALASDLARFQAQQVPGYARLCRARGVDPSRVARAAEAPAVPTDAFKLARVAAFPEAETCVVFRTSGTTVGTRGEHAMRDTGSYDAAARAFGRWALASDLPGRVPVLVLGPGPFEAPDSSLVHMMALFVFEFGEPATDEQTYFVRNGVLELPALDERIVRAMMAWRIPVLLLGTSLSFAYLLDTLDRAMFRLPPGSRVMHTGGYKGKGREVSAGKLRADLARAFALEPRAIVGEYGMTELSSQFYEATLRDPHARAGVFIEPPWARVIPVDPETLAPVPDGEIGLARIEDLMNVDSAFAVLAADRVRRVDGGFELLGRAPGSAPRGCSVAIDELLGP